MDQKPAPGEKKFKVLIAAGGTGGHIFPGIATGTALKSLYPNCEITYACGQRELELNIYKSNGIEPLVFPSKQLGSGLMSRVRAVFAALSITMKARRYIKQNAINAVVGFGGYVSGPVTLGGVFSGAKTAIHEANSIPGKTNRILAPLVNLTAVHFPITLAKLKARKKIVTGMPIRPLAVIEDKRTAREKLGLHPEKKTLLIMGGSQGAKFLYQKIAAALPSVDKELSEPLQIYWSTGEANFAELQSTLAEMTFSHLEIKLTPFIADMGTALSATDISIARAGASALAELVSFNIYTLYVPFPAAIYDHQTLNAQQIERYGAGAVLPEKSLTSQTITRGIIKALVHAKKNQKFPIPDELNSSQAAEKLAREIASLA